MRKKADDKAKEISIRETANLKWRNEVVNGKYSMTLREFKMLVALACQIDKNAENFELLSISAKDLGDLMELDENGSYRIIKETARKLFSRDLYFEDTAHVAKKRKSKEKSWLLLHWFSRIGYNADSSRLEFKFADEVKPLLLQVKEAYVNLQSKPLMNFNSVYTSRFFMLFTEWEKMKSRVISISELREVFQIGDKYPLFANFNQKVVLPAVDEINKKTDFKIKTEPIKTGRSYTHYKFYITRKKSAKTIDVQCMDEQQQAVYDKLVGYGLSSKFVSTYIKSRSLEDVIANLEYAEKYKDTAANFPAYLRNCLENDYGKNGLFTEQKEAEAAAAKLAEMTEEEKARAIAFAEFIRQQQAVAAEAAEKAAQYIPADKTTVQAGLDKLKEKLQKRGTEDATL